MISITPSPDEFELIRRGQKTFTVVRRDPDLSVGLEVAIRHPDTDQEFKRRITCMEGYGSPGISPGYVVLALRRPSFQERE